ncbi:MAG: alkaline phosphatase family protein [Rhodospirillaceae bacterium]|nr:alkaline phosphatase family protein [Rhodospirillaceae bacterium]
MIMLRRRTVAQLMATAALAPLSAAAQGTPPLSRIAFGSCANQRAPQPIWDAILAYRPQLFIFTGDNVYGDIDAANIEGLRQAYEKAGQIEGYAKLRRSVRHLATWDDHDYGKNDAGAELAFKDAAKEEFLKFWNVPADDARRSRGGIYDSRIIGPPGMRVQVILLDLRWFRSPLKQAAQRPQGKGPYTPDPDPAKTLLGEIQWSWLAQELRKPAEVRLLVTSLQVLSNGHNWECWENLPTERQKLFDTIRQAKANGVVLLSGDRHFGALYREQPAGLYPLTEITASGLNIAYWAVNEPATNRLGGVYPVANFGVVEIDWWERTIGLALRDEGGTVRRSTTIKADDLVFAT